MNSRMVLIFSYNLLFLTNIQKGGQVGTILLYSRYLERSLDGLNLNWKIQNWCTRKTILSEDGPSDNRNKLLIYDIFTSSLF